MTITWEDPSESRTEGTLARSDEMRAFGEQLKLHPGKWALFKVHNDPARARQQASNINCGNIKSLRGFESRARAGKVYVRWPESSAAEDTTIGQDELRDFIDRLGNGWTPNELAEQLRINFDIYPRSAS
jgi:hypothetical protein